MTPQLQARIDEITCKHCAGVGQLSNSESTRYGGQVFISRWAEPCGECKGTGVQKPQTGLRIV